MVGKLPPRVQTILSRIFFGLFVLFVIIFIFLAIFDTSTTTTIVRATSTPSPAVTHIPQPVPVVNKLVSKIVLNQNQITISPVVSVAVLSGTPSNTAPAIPPNMVPPTLTYQKPLQQTPQALGLTCMLSDGSQLLSSFPNGECAFCQFNEDTEQPSVPYAFATNSYVTQQSGISNSNRILAFDQGSLILNKSASANGCIGVKSIVLSLDDLRLYVAYRDSNVSNPFAFASTVGRVQVWTRASKDTDVWSHTDSLSADLSNPFGSQIVGIPVQGSPLGNNSFLETQVTGDEFGSAMCASYRVATNINLSTSSAFGDYAIGVGSQTGVSASVGRCINMFEEQPSLIYECTGILFLPTSGVLSSTFTVADRSSFGTAFTVVGDTCIASLGSHAVPSSCRLANFRFVNHAWTFVDVILPPNENEFFGTSLAMAFYGGVLIVGSPASSQSGNNTAPRGGHVYMYVRSTTGVWSLSYSLIDPFLTTDFPNLFTFGWFVNVSRDFRFLTVSANQDSVYRPNFPLARPAPNSCQFTDAAPTTPCSYTCFEVFGIDQMKNVVDITHVARVFQDSNASQFIDPLFSAHVDIAQTSAGTLFLTGSPLNQNVSLFVMASS